MASFGKLSASVLPGTQELVATLGNFNFDFSLVKVCFNKVVGNPIITLSQLEAPSEFQGLGAALTSNRREIAEAGKPHVTARKLGALFEAVIPYTPRLVEAYGTRVSEIATSIVANPRALMNEEIFADYIGADGTSIWAAATSGSAAISVHLLVCMLFVTPAYENNLVTHCSYCIGLACGASQRRSRYGWRLSTLENDNC